MQTENNNISAKKLSLWFFSTVMSIATIIMLYLGSVETPTTLQVEHFELMQTVFYTSFVGIGLLLGHTGFKKLIS